MIFRNSWAADPCRSQLGTVLYRNHMVPGRQGSAALEILKIIESPLLKTLYSKRFTIYFLNSSPRSFHNIIFYCFSPPSSLLNLIILMMLLSTLLENSGNMLVCYVYCLILFSIPFL